MSDKAIKWTGFNAIDVGVLLQLDFQFTTGGDMSFDGTDGKVTVKVGQYIVRKDDGSLMVIDGANFRVADGLGQVEQVTDAERTLVASLILAKAFKFFPSGCVGEKALIMGRVVLELQRVMGRVIRAKTKHDLGEAERELMTVPDGA